MGHCRITDNTISVFHNVAHSQSGRACYPGYNWQQMSEERDLGFSNTVCFLSTFWDISIFKRVMYILYGTCVIHIYTSRIVFKLFVIPFLIDAVLSPSYSYSISNDLAPNISFIVLTLLLQMYIINQSHLNWCSTYSLVVRDGHIGSLNMCI